MNRKKILAAGLAIVLSVVVVAMGQARRDAASDTAPTTTASPMPTASTKGQQPSAGTASALPVPASATAAPANSSGDPRVHASDDAALRLEGEKRYRANCGRCHVAPPKFPARAMATVLRHMRVRALITDEDQKLILHYMTE